MPGNNRIRRLPDLLHGDFSQAKLDTLSREFDALTQDSAAVLPWIIETKGREELDLPQKMARLRLWCDDATAAEDTGTRYAFVFVDQKSFEQHVPQTFASLTASFTEYQKPS